MKMADSFSQLESLMKCNQEPQGLYVVLATAASRRQWIRTQQRLERSARIQRIYERCIAMMSTRRIECQHAVRWTMCKIQQRQALYCFDRGMCVATMCVNPFADLQLSTDVSVELQS